MPLSRHQLIPSGGYRFNDRHRTVFTAAARGVEGGNLSGVRIHAHALSQLMEHRRVAHLSPALKWALLFGLAFTGMIMALLDTSIFVKAALFVSSLVALWCAILLSYYMAQTPLPFLTSNFTLATSFVFGIAYLGHDDRMQKKLIKQTFSRYLAPKIVDMLLADPSAMKAGGARRELTYIFTDLADFTSLTERSDPEVLVDLLNEYIDGMCTIAFHHEGTVDKIIGDAMVAFFGGPD